jgi:hypothetical protein
MIGNIAAGLYGVGVTPSTNSYESIATVSVGSGGQSTISFTSIPSTYKHLEIRFIGNKSTSGLGYGTMSFNSDTTASNYSYHELFGNGSAAYAGNAINTYAGTLVQKFGGSDASSTFGSGVISILDYASTAKNKTVRSLGGIDRNGSGEILFISGAWYNNTSAINSISIVPSAGSFAQYSSFALYGIKD